MSTACSMRVTIQLPANDMAVALACTGYRVIAEWPDGKRLAIRSDDEIGETLEEAKRLAKTDSQERSLSI